MSDVARQHTTAPLWDKPIVSTVGDVTTVGGSGYNPLAELEEKINTPDPPQELADVAELIDIIANATLEGNDRDRHSAIEQLRSTLVSEIDVRVAAILKQNGLIK